MTGYSIIKIPKKVLFLLVLLLAYGCEDNKSIDKDGIYIDLYQGKSHLFVKGKPFEARGVAGSKYIGEASEIGATIVRTWDEFNAKEVLDSASANEMYVLLGIYLPKPSDDNDYTSDSFRDKQKKIITAIVNQFKNHPALLGWGVGNEIEVYPKDFQVWRRLNSFVRLVKEIDPNHPVTSVIAPFRKSILYSKLFLNDIDFLSVNTFGDIVDLEKKLNHPVLGWRRPVMITEWGTNGPWEEIEKTDWGSPIEKNSTTKAVIIKNRYKKYLTNNPDLDNLGSFIFYWGNIVQYTNTWFSIFSENGRKSQTYYTMQEIWGHSLAHNNPPVVSGIFINNKSAYDNIILSRGQDVFAKIWIIDPESDSLKYKWRLSKDNLIDDEYDRLMIGLEDENVTFKLNENKVEFNLSVTPGPYRLFVEVYDEGENYAYANIPFYVVD